MSEKLDYLFVPIPKHAVFRIKDPRAMQVYVAARHLSNWNTGEMSVQARGLAEKLDLSQRTVREALSVLKSLGYMGLKGKAGAQKWWVIPPNEVLTSGVQSGVGVREKDHTQKSVGVRESRRVGGGNNVPPSSGNQHSDAPETSKPTSDHRSDHSGSLLPKREIQDHNKQTREQGLKAVGEIQDRETDPRTSDKPRQEAFGLEVQEPETLDPERLLAGDYDGRPDDPRVIRAAIALWSSAWSTRPGAVIVTKPRQKAWTEAIRAGCTPSHYARAILGMRWETTAPVQPGDFNRFKCCDFEYITRRPDAYAAVFDERGDPRQTPGFIPGKTFLGSTAPGGGRGGDRAHGGSGEVLMGQAALDKVAAETRERRERDRKQAEESSTPEAIEARRLAFEAMDAITARKGGGRR